MSEIRDIKINVPAPVSRTRKGKKIPKVNEPKKGGFTQKNVEEAVNKAMEKTLEKSIGLPIAKKAEQSKIVGGDPMPVLSTIRFGGAKKPVVKVPLPYANSQHTPSPSKPVQAPVKLVQKPVSRKVKTPIKILVQPTKRKNFTLKRKFTEKRIIIQVENSNKVKKNRESIEKQVLNMPLSEITERLRKRGLVRPMSNPPESMQRTMMIDIMMFPTPL